jgi:hypothetical protein
MALNIIISSILALVLFGAFNGLIIRWHYEPIIDKRAMWSKWWHRCAMAIRVFIWLIVWFVSEKSWLITVTVILATAVEYNITINLINNLKWYYVGTTSKTDKLIRKLFSFIKFDK